MFRTFLYFCGFSEFLSCLRTLFFDFLLTQILKGLTVYNYLYLQNQTNFVKKKLRYEKKYIFCIYLDKKIYIWPKKVCVCLMMFWGSHWTHQNFLQPNIWIFYWGTLKMYFLSFQDFFNTMLLFLSIKVLFHSKAFISALKERFSW